MSEEEISVVLDTYMYIDYREADDGMSMEEILQELASSPDCREGGIHYGEYQILLKAAENPEIGSLVISNQSHLMGCDTGTVACSFQTPDQSCTYIVYRGTSDGEWPDNGIGMTEVSTIQQERALAYFETCVENLGITGEQRLVVTGHSKGGNKAQYAVMSTKYGDLADVCYSVDGQGFSEDAIAGWKEKWGEEGFEKRRNKIIGIYGENDYVSVLGHSIVPEKNIYYVKTPVEKTNFAGYHDIKYMFAKQVTNPVTGKTETVFSGERNDYALQRGALGNYGAELSAKLMALPRQQRDGCAAVIMQLMEVTRGSKEGVNKEKLTLSDIGDFLTEAPGMLRDSLLFTTSGGGLLYSAFCQDSFAGGMQGNVYFKIREEGILGQAEELRKLALCIRQEKERLTEVMEKLSFALSGEVAMKQKLTAQKRELAKLELALNRSAEQLTEILMLYKNSDEAVFN